MLAVVEIVVFTALVVIKADQVSFEGVIKVTALDQHIRTEDYLVLLGDESSLHKSVARLKPYVHHGLQCKV